MDMEEENQKITGSFHHLVRLLEQFPAFREK